jgi:hypothetical protein
MTSADALKKLVEQARSSPAFFHELVFDPEKVIGRLKYLDKKTKSKLLAIDPAQLIRNLVPIDVAECGDTCGAGSCSNTCGAGSCLDTCKSSCGGTCGNSCDHTSGMPTKFIPDDPQKVGGIQVAGLVGRAAAPRARAARRKR